MFLKVLSHTEMKWQFKVLNFCLIKPYRFNDNYTGELFSNSESQIKIKIIPCIK